MSITLTADPLPLARDEHGSIRIGNTRVLLEMVIRAHQGGATADDIARRFDTLEIADVHAVLAHCLRHRDEVEEYLTRREIEAHDLRKEIEGAIPPRVSREELQARWAARSLEYFTEFDDDGEQPDQPPPEIIVIPPIKQMSD